ncbi:hypothetical protein B0T25DRAFT_565940 [Lasiosphaeria hispida]|uniref:histidine kinase n=1 Tax=Lasiosphaeria hispida TaxID=260671 RepID=A0AAJ0MFD2_9PEZI|nr:hypothetical protein B0T25DRAFT_565940 [Lasiosphaeria hispida]
MFDDSTQCAVEAAAGDDAAEAAKQSAVAACAAIEVESYERARQREIAAYLSAASFPLDLPSGPGAEPFLNADDTLNALVQLGALRLGCDRSFLSLIDRQHQFVVSEMTRSHSIREMKWDGDDRVWLGVAKLDACWGVCPTTMKAFVDETGAWARTGPNVIANRTRYIVNDFRTDPAYKDRSYVTAFPWFVSYLEVPLVSSLGYLLGSYCVIDNKLHDYDNDETVGAMNDIAGAIMTHLDNMRMRQNRQRSEQLIDGLSGFIRSDPSPPPGSLATDQYLNYTGAAAGTRLNNPNEPKQDRGPGAVAEDSRPLPVAQPSALASASSIESSFSAPSLLEPGESAETPMTSLADEVSQDPLEQQVIAQNLNTARAEDLEARSPSPPLSASSSVPESHANGFISSANIKSAFFRAATTIRQTMNMDGLMFLDAVPSTYLDHSEPLMLDPTGRNAHYDEPAGPFCAAIVQSAADHAEKTATQSPQTRLPEAALQRFIRRYPRGHVFSADEFGPIEEIYGPGKPFPGISRTDRDNIRLRSDVATLFQVIPDAKYIIFLPLWHFQRECWYAATLGWVTDPTRAIDVGDISLVSAFGNSVMAEVSRMEALDASRAKSSFVSSISHELRSPLHGILASSELIREGISDPSLLSTLDMLDSCGKTLLDTFNNLLDHAIAIKDRKGTRTPISKLQVVDLAELVEDVVEAVHFSHLSENAFQSSLRPKVAYSKTKLREPAAGKEGGPLLVTLKIAKRATWKLPADIGAWKRIVMNIFSNALKYTTAGRIEVGLKVAPRLDRAGIMCSHVSFTVDDTGRGMSSDYLKYRLFTPFSQEDTYSMGIGLGLSIVQQLATGLGGVIEVKSSVGVGTLVEVSIPVQLNSAATTAEPLLPAEWHHRLSGRTACLITPEAYAALVKTQLTITKEMQARAAIVENTLRANAGEVLDMNVTLATADCPVPRADLYLLDSHVFAEITKDNGPGTLHSALSPLPLVLICSDAAPPSGLKRGTEAENAIRLHHPIGPKKIAAVFDSALGARLRRHTDDDIILPAPRLIPELFPAHEIPLPISRSPSPPEELLAKRVQSLEGHDNPLLANAVLQPTPNTHGSITTIHTPSTTPLIQTQSPHTPNSQTPSTQTSATRPLNLLLVDDNPINIKLLATVVRKLGHTYATACNGLEAVQLYQASLDQNSLFDTVFMDISMPVMDGFEATREIRRLETEAGVMQRCKIAALTGLSSEDSRKEALASGSDLFLTKPVKLNTVKRMLSEELDRNT